MPFQSIENELVLQQQELEARERRVSERIGVLQPLHARWEQGGDIIGHARTVSAMEQLTLFTPKVIVDDGGNIIPNPGNDAYNTPAALSGYRELVEAFLALNSDLTGRQRDIFTRFLEISRGLQTDYQRLNGMPNAAVRPDDETLWSYAHEKFEELQSTHPSQPREIYLPTGYGHYPFGSNGHANITKIDTSTLTVYDAYVAEAEVLGKRDGITYVRAVNVRQIRLGTDITALINDCMVKTRSVYGSQEYEAAKQRIDSALVGHSNTDISQVVDEAEPAQGKDNCTTHSQRSLLRMALKNDGAVFDRFMTFIRSMSVIDDVTRFHENLGHEISKLGTEQQQLVQERIALDRTIEEERKFGEHYAVLERIWDRQGAPAHARHETLLDKCKAISDRLRHRTSAPDEQNVPHHGLFNRVGGRGSHRAEASDIGPRHRR